MLCIDSSGFAAARATAGAADVVVFVGGGGPWRGGQGAVNATEGEEYDRTNITLPGLQEDLIRAVLDAGKPVVLVLMRGGPIALSDTLLADPRITSIVNVCYPGEMGGDGLAAVLFGVIAPSGRLSTTIYDAAFVTSRNITDYNFSSGDGVTHLYYTKVPQWVYGFGLSTTTWQLAWLSSDTETPSQSAATAVTIDALSFARARSSPPYGVLITNTGTLTSDLSLLAFISSGLTGDPLQQLFDFGRVANIAPGANATLYFSVPSTIAARISDDGKSTIMEGEYNVRIGAPGEQMLDTKLVILGGQAALD